MGRLFEPWMMMFGGWSERRGVGWLVGWLVGVEEEEDGDVLKRLHMEMEMWEWRKVENKSCSRGEVDMDLKKHGHVGTAMSHGCKAGRSKSVAERGPETLEPAQLLAYYY
jgi:hypothetical protein